MVLTRLRTHAAAIDGSMDLYVDGKKVVSKSDMQLRGSADQKIDYLLFHNFFGGSSSDWAAPKDEVRLPANTWSYCICTALLSDVIAF